MFKNAIVSNDVIFYFLNNQGIKQGCDSVKLIKCDTGEKDEKCDYADDIILTCPMDYLLFYCHIIS